MANRKKNQEPGRVSLIRNLILGLIGLLVIGVGALGTWYSVGSTDGSFAEGRDWTVMTDAPAAGSGPLTVTEFFSYGCIHCRDFDPMIDRWQEDLPADVRFVRAPLSFSPLWGLLAQTYLALEYEDALEQNHRRLFTAIHDQQRQFLSADQLADFVDGRGVTREQFLSTFNGSRIKRRLNEIDQLARAAQVRSVPTLVVADRYRIDMGGGRKRALEIVDHLLALERAARDA